MDPDRFFQNWWTTIPSLLLLSLTSKVHFRGTSLPAEVQEKFEELQDVVATHGTLAKQGRVSDTTISNLDLSVYIIYIDITCTYMYALLNPILFEWMSRFSQSWRITSSMCKCLWGWNYVQVPTPKLPANFEVRCLKNFFNAMKIGPKARW